MSQLPKLTAQDLVYLATTSDPSKAIDRITEEVVYSPPEEELKRMAQTKAERSRKHDEWAKKNTSRFYVKLNHHTDEDLIIYLMGMESKAGVIKKALREYIENHKDDFIPNQEYLDDADEDDDTDET